MSRSSRPGSQSSRGATSLISAAERGAVAADGPVGDQLQHAGARREGQLVTTVAHHVGVRATRTHEGLLCVHQRRPPDPVPEQPRPSVAADDVALVVERHLHPVTQIEVVDDQLLPPALVGGRRGGKPSCDGDRLVESVCACHRGRQAQQPGGIDPS